MSVISLPTTLVLTSGKGSALLKPLNDAVETISNEAKTKFDKFDQELSKNYSDFGGQVVENAQSGPQTISAQLQTMSKSASDAASFANKHAADVNHGAFQLGYLIKAVLKHIPHIIKESVIEAIGGGEDKHLLSVQKIYNIASSDKFGEFVGAMSDMVKTYGSTLQNLSNEDTGGIIQIFKEIKNEEEDIKKFLSNVKTNAEALKNESDANSYCATKLMMHVLIGKNTIESVKQTIESLTNTLNKLKVNITTILETMPQNQKINVDDLVKQLEAIKTKSDAMKDPCPNK